MLVVRLVTVYFLLLSYVTEKLSFHSSATQDLPPKETESSMSSSYGQEFYIGFMRNFGGTSFTSLRLRLSTTSESAAYVVESRVSGVIQNGTVNNMSPVTVDVSSTHQVTNSDFNNREKGLHVYTTNGAPISVIAESFVLPFNHGVFLAYPCLEFEAEMYEYHVISAEVVSSLVKSQVLLVGCENDTDISILPSQSINLPEDFQNLSSPMISHNTEIVVNGTLHQMQTLLIYSEADLTRTVILSNKPLTVISGHECATVPSHLAGCEPLAVQVPPSLTWGNTFLLLSFTGRDTDTAYKLLSKENTSVLVVCDTASVISNKTTFQFSVTPNVACFLRSIKPILLTQLATSGSGDNKGDPAISLVSPVDQYVNSVSFMAPPENTFSKVYISVTVSVEHFNSSSILFNDEVLGCEWIEIHNDSGIISAVVGYGCTQDITARLANDLVTQHKVSHADSNGLLSVIVYGFSPHLGFAYLAGQEITEGFIGSTESIMISPDHINVLQFLDITTFPGIAELSRVEDASSDPISIPNGLLFGHELATSAYVNENGVISFNKPWGFAYPENFPTPYYWTQQGKAIAPFWSDNDIRKEGTVRYVTYCNITDAAECSYHEQSQELLDEVNHFLQTNHDENTGTFSPGYWILIAQWDGVYPYPHGADDTQGISEQELKKTNTYQAVLISNMIRTTLIFTYTCGDIQWSTSGSNNNAAAVIGYNVAGKRYYNHLLSRNPFIGDSVSCAIRVTKRRKRQSGNFANSIILNIPNTVGECRRMLFLDESKHSSAAISMYANLESLSPCPCTKAQADEDLARFRKQNDLPNCYVTMNSLFTEENQEIGQRNSIVRQCCYHYSGALITSPSESAGSLLLQHPITESQKYTDQGQYFGDKIFKETCCNKRSAELSEDEDYCGLFFKRRPVSLCDGYTPAVPDSNFPPIISAPFKLRMNVGEQATLTLKVTDTRDDLTLTVQDGLPGNFTLEEQSDGEFVFRWTLQEVTNDPLVFIANDSRGASSLFTPIVEICACVNGGQCTLEGIVTGNTTIIMNCLCTEAFDGQFCEEDRNGCSEIQCFEGVRCMDVPAPGVGAVCGSCPPGYTGDALKCYDVDECFLDKTLCEQDCTNIDGGYLCSCFNGYQLVEGTNQCQDVDECLSLNGCHQECQNTLGSYACSCSDGYSLLSNDKDCVANEPCDRNCSFGCALIGGVEMCYCPVGFQLDRPNGTQCIDQNECSMIDPCDQVCINTEGLFICSCKSGYKLASNENSCEDIDECLEAALESIDLCASISQTQCVNTEGSYQCVCVPGYTEMSGECKVHDEAPPVVMAAIPALGQENNVTLFSAIYSLQTFTPDVWQLVRKVGAVAVNRYCLMKTCHLVTSLSGKSQMQDMLVTIDPRHVAIPPSLIGLDNNGQLTFTIYVQVGDSFLPKEQLKQAIMHSEKLFKDDGFSLFSSSASSSASSVPELSTGALIGIVVSVIILLVIIAIILALTCVCVLCSQKVCRQCRHLNENPRNKVSVFSTSRFSKKSKLGNSGTPTKETEIDSTPPSSMSPVADIHTEEVSPQHQQTQQEYEERNQPLKCKGDLESELLT